MMKKIKLVSIFILSVILTVTFAFPAQADLLTEKNEELIQIRKQIDEQQSFLSSARSRSASLQNQVDLLDGQITVAELQLQALNLQIDQTNASISQTNQELVSGEISVFEKKQVLRHAIKESYMRRQTGIFEVLLGSSDLSEMISQLEYISAVESRITGSLVALKELNETLKAKKGELEVADQELRQLIAVKELEQGSMQIQIDTKAVLLGDAQLTEAEYQQRLSASVVEQQRLQSEIAQLARSSRRGEMNVGEFGLFWPVPSRLVTAGFREASYLARFGIQHNAIDLATPQGTPIKAPASAFVSKVRFDGSTRYSYIVLDHGNGMVTVYGHVSGVSVSVGQFVPSGAVIGFTGATPGTVGAGWMTTGPHLHFEVWLNGQARNPLSYLAN